MSNYKGMRWLKCDLQMQTPADSAHWKGEQITPGKDAEAAKSFAEACYQKRLDVVGITDHNFLSKDFLSHIRTAFTKIEVDHSHKITLFPGFEFEAAGVGKGVHVLCLFEPDTDLNKVDMILTECGVTFPRHKANGELQKSDKNIKDILRIVQEIHCGIVILPHAMSNDGIFDNENVSEWLQMDQFVNPNLFAVEVPKPVHKMSKAFQALFRSGDDCIPGWKRIRPIATIMSSDNKTLIDNDVDGKPKPNSIGYRYSWIKMSSPSIESLRQAFLDHQSRIVLPDNVANDKCPSLLYPHPRIVSITISDTAFLEDQTIEFSPNFNCMIGGRGSGKSSVLEYLRFAFTRNDTDDLDDETKAKIQRIKGTLGPTSKIVVVWENPDVPSDTIEYVNGSVNVTSRTISDISTFLKGLPVEFYSQQQLNRLTEAKMQDGASMQAERLLDLIDGFHTKEFKVLAENESTQVRIVTDGFEKTHRIKELGRILLQRTQEKEELERQYRARQEIQAPAKLRQFLKEEAQFIGELEHSGHSLVAEANALADRISKSHHDFGQVETPNRDWIISYAEKVRTERRALADKIALAIKDYSEQLYHIQSSDDRLSEVKTCHSLADENFRTACARLGLTNSDVGRIQEIGLEIKSKESDIRKLQDDILQLKTEVGDVNTSLSSLHQIWQKQFEQRKVAASRANQLARLSDSSQPFIDVSVQYQSNKSHFEKLWNSLKPNGTTRLGRRWEQIGEELYKKFIESNPPVSSIWEHAEACIVQPELAEQIFRDVMTEFQAYLGDNRAKWCGIRCTRVKDIVDMTLFRPDGTEAGRISLGSLSDGQRNTAALALLLAQNGGPLVIDQPEDELDSNFVFRELIPMIRKIKSTRQLIIATHNANLPVNGDSELVYALEAKGGKGTMKSQGGLDCSDVTKSVLEIMEGTEEAFRRRREKYHF